MAKSFALRSLFLEIIEIIEIIDDSIGFFLISMISTFSLILPFHLFPLIQKPAFCSKTIAGFHSKSRFFSSEIQILDPAFLRSRRFFLSFKKKAKGDAPEGAS